MEGGRAVWPWHRAQLVAGAPSIPQATVTPRSLSCYPSPALSLCPHSAAALGHGGRYTKPMRKIEYENRSRSREKNKQKINSLFFMPLPPHSPLLATPVVVVVVVCVFIAALFILALCFPAAFCFFSRQLQFGSATRHCVGEIGNAWKCR